MFVILLKITSQPFMLSEDISYFYVLHFVSSCNKQTFYIEIGLHCCDSGLSDGSVCPN